MRWLSKNNNATRHEGILGRRITYCRAPASHISKAASKAALDADLSASRRDALSVTFHQSPESCSLLGGVHEPEMSGSHGRGRLRARGTELGGTRSGSGNGEWEELEGNEVLVFSATRSPSLCMSPEEGNGRAPLEENLPRRASSFESQ